MFSNRHLRRLGLPLAVVAVVLSSCSSGSSGGNAASSSTLTAQPVSGLVQGADGVLLEYRDWGGEGPPIVLLTGLGNSAAVFDDLAPRLTAKHRVIGLTRRGFAPSTVTDDGYDVPTRVADDIAALNALGIDRALFVGHSISGDELTSLVRQRPDLVAGLVYLDSAIDRSDPVMNVFDECAPLTPRIDQVVDMSADILEVDGQIGLRDMEAASRLQKAQLGGPLPFTEVLRRFYLGPGGVVLDVEPIAVVAAINAGSDVFTPDYRGITVPVTVLVGDDSDPAVAFPVAAQASDAVKAQLADCARRIAAAKRSAGADRVREQVPGAVIEVVPGGPHYFFLQQPDLVVDRILTTAQRAGW